MPDSDVLTVYTTAWCGDCVAAKRALEGLGVPFEEVRLEEDDDAVDLVERLNDGRRSVPTLAYAGRATSLSRFEPRRLREFLHTVGLTAAPHAASGD